MRRVSSFLSTVKSAFTSERSISFYNLPPKCQECDLCHQQNLPTPHERTPDYLDINTTDSLRNTMKPFKFHVLLSTGKGSSKHWPSKTDDLEPTSIIRRIESIIKQTETNGRVMITMIDKEEGEFTDCWDDGIERKYESGWLNELDNIEVIVLPQFVKLNLNRNDIEDKLPPLLLNPSPQSTDEAKKIILICSHLKRDKRCGVMSSLLRTEFETQIFDHGIVDNTLVYGCSHVGGHKYAGNVLVYPPGDVYGRVNTCHVKNIVEESVLGDKVIKELWRGRIGES